MLNKRDIPINFSQGVNTKADPWQVPAGQFLSLENSIFTKAGLLQKRNGYVPLSTLPATASYITTLNGGLTALSNSEVYAYNSPNATWVDDGPYTSLKVATQPIVRNNVNQTQCDSVVAPNGLMCTAYTETVNSAATYWFVVSNSSTGRLIVAPQALGNAVGSPRVFLLGNYFVIVYTTHPSSYFLEYLAIPVARLYDALGNVNVTTAQVSASSVSPASTVAWDGAVVAERLFIAFTSTSGGQSVKVTYLTPQDVAAARSGVSPTVFLSGSFTATAFSVCGDITDPSNPLVFVTFLDTANSDCWVAGLSFDLVKLYTNPRLIRTGVDAATWTDITSAARNGVCQVFGEATHTYTWGSIPSNYIETVSVDSSGTITSSHDVFIRSVGLASKAFLLNNTVYFLAAFQSPFQPTYFLISGESAPSNPVVVAKLAYENGGGYLTTGLPGVTVSGNSVSIAYLYKDLVEALTTDQSNKQTTAGGIYSQTGVNLATFTFGSQIDSAEIAGSLHLGGGFLWQYDGHTAVEHNFFLWPDSVNAVWSATGGSIHAQPDGATNTNAYYYQVTYEWTDNAGNIHRSAPSIPVAVTTTSSGTTGSITVKVPTLRLTYKTATPVNIVVYRWSVANQVYHQVTSVAAPLQNDPTADSITFVDTQADASIQGNALIYTTGGVVEDVNAPATSIIALFDTRLWMVDDEDRNLLWFSKQVIENTPVEMSDLFTFYIAPTSGSQGSTGPITALAPVDDKLILFKENAIYYINGSGPDNTGANNQYSQPIFVTSTVGCADQQSIVFMPNGLMFQSDKGIWLLDRGMNTTYIGAPVESYTQQATVVSALNIPGTNQVRFTLDTGITLMYDYFYGQWGTFVNVPAVSSCIFQGMHTYLSDAGLVLQETPGVYTDNGEPTLMAFTTSWFNFASLQGFERAYYFYLLGQYFSPHLLSIGVSYNYVPGPVHTSLIRPDNYSSATPSPYGDQPAPFGSPTALEQWRVFFKQQKCQSFQISLQEIYDPSFGVPAGAGFTLTGLSLKVAEKRGTRPLPARKSV